MLLTLRRFNAKYLFFGMLLGIIVGLIIAVLLPKQYEAKSLIKIGQIGNVDTRCFSIELSLYVVDRNKIQFFQDTVLERLDASTKDDDDMLVNQFESNLKVKLEKSELIPLSLKALTREEALVMMQEVVKHINIKHNSMMLPTVQG